MDMFSTCSTGPSLANRNHPRLWWRLDSGLSAGLPQGGHLALSSSLSVAVLSTESATRLKRSQGVIPAGAL